MTIAGKSPIFLIGDTSSFMLVFTLSCCHVSFRESRNFEITHSMNLAPANEQIKKLPLKRLKNPCYVLTLPRKLTCPLKNWWLEDVTSYWNSPFLGDMLISFGGLFFVQNILLRFWILNHWFNKSTSYEVGVSPTTSPVTHPPPIPESGLSGDTPWDTATGKGTTNQHILTKVLSGKLWGNVYIHQKLKGSLPTDP